LNKITDEFRLELKRLHGSSIHAGEAGEELTRQALEKAGLPWFFIEQGKATKAAGLRTNRCKRVDFVVGWKGNCLLLDSKCFTPTHNPDGSVTFLMPLKEIDELRATGILFGLPVALIIWFRSGAQRRFVADEINCFALNAAATEYVATFPASEIVVTA
jgi:hypothetical protein